MLRSAALCIRGESECPTGCPITQNTRVLPLISANLPSYSDDPSPCEVPVLGVLLLCTTAGFLRSLPCQPASPAASFVLLVRAHQHLGEVRSRFSEGPRGRL